MSQHSKMKNQDQNFDAFLTALQHFLLTTPGEGSGLVDLEPIFTENLQKIHQTVQISLIIGVLIAGVVVYVMFFYQQGRVYDEQINIEIFRAMGATSREVRKLIFTEQSVTLGAGLLLAFIGMLYILILFLLQDAYFPPIWLPFSVLFGVGGLLTILNQVNSAHLTRKYHSKINAILL